MTGDMENDLIVKMDKMEDEIFELREQFRKMEDKYSHSFVIIIAILISFMQCGFAFLETGSVRSKNTVNILAKNLLNTLIGGVSYWAIGWGLAHGGGGNAFVGGSEFFGYGLNDHLYPRWLFSFMFAITASTIVSGALAERCEMIAYALYSIVITSVVIPAVSHWAWEEGRPLKLCNFTSACNESAVGRGWLYEGQYTDFSGAGVVHLLGGTFSLVGCYVIGPREGRFTAQGKPIAMPGHSLPLAALGGFILMFGFLGFNAYSLADKTIVGVAVVNTMLGGCSGGLTVLILTRATGSLWSFLTTLNGVLVGMVSLTAGCDSYEPWAALVVGAGAGFCYLGTSAAMLRAGLDDPLDAVAVHGSGGLWGLMSISFLCSRGGIFKSSGGWMVLAYNTAGACAIIAWTGIWSAALFTTLNYFGALRIGPDTERTGMDFLKHGESAYPATAWVEVQYDEKTTPSNLPAQMSGHSGGGMVIRMHSNDSRSERIK